MSKIIHCHIHTVYAYKFSEYGGYHKYNPGDKRGQQNAYKRAQNDKDYWTRKIATKPQRYYPLRRLLGL